MIEITLQEVEMPDMDKRRFQRIPNDCDGRNWRVEDTEHKRVVYRGKFEEASLVCHNLNKKHYLNQNKTA